MSLSDINQKGQILIVGEICIDVSLAGVGQPMKMRLGGIVHAARGLWAANIPYSVAVICPDYLVDEAKNYLGLHGCLDFFLLGTVSGAPNVFIVHDVREVGHQGYEDLLRDTKSVRLNDLMDFGEISGIVVFPGAFDLAAVLEILPKHLPLFVDAAYNIENEAALDQLTGRVTALVISTSSDLFGTLAPNDLVQMLGVCKRIGAEHLLLKENRGGSQLFSLTDGLVEQIPAVLGETKNSVGVGDAYTAVFAALYREGPPDAAWRGMQIATQYSQTTFPDDLRLAVQRELALTVPELHRLGGVELPWFDRPRFQIYLAAPDFTYVDTSEIDNAVSSLEYHNFRVRRPVQENGEAELGTPPEKLRQFYQKDVDLLDDCDLVFAIPLGRDPGTLVELGMGIAAGIPVITFDLRNENQNTMVVCGSSTYSNDLDACINGVFECLSKLLENKP